MALSIVQRLKRGDVLHMAFVDGKRMWWFDCPYQPVSDIAVYRAGHEVELVEAGDSLFNLRNNSQTWMAARGGVQ